MARLPHLREDTSARFVEEGGKTVVELTYPSGPVKRMSRRVYDAVRLIDTVEHFEDWSLAVAQMHPKITQTQLHQLIDALAKGGFCATPVEDGIQHEDRTAAHDPYADAVHSFDGSGPKRRPAFLEEQLATMPGAPLPASPPQPIAARSSRPPSPSSPSSSPPAAAGPKKLSSEITQIGRVSDRPPKTRRDISAKRTDKAGVVSVAMPDGAHFDMPEGEYRILLALDGTRDLFQVQQHLESKGISYGVGQLATFVQMMMQRGLVFEGDPPNMAKPGDDLVAAARGHMKNGDWQLAETVLQGLVAAVPDHAEGQELLVLVKNETERAGGAAPATGDAPATDGEAPAAEPAVVAGSAGDQVWDEAAAQVAASPEVRRRQLIMRLKRIARVGAVPAVLLLASAVIHYPLKVTYAATVKPLDRFVVRAPRDGVISDVLVDEGQKVEAGTLLGHMADADEKTKVVQIQSDLEKARAELELLHQGSRKEEVDRVGARVGGLYHEIQVAQNQKARVAAAVKQGIAPRGELDSAEARLAALNAEAAQASAELKLVKAGARPDDIKKKEAEVRAQESKLAFEQGLLDSATLKTDLAGVVTTTKPKNLVNTRVAPGDIIFEVASFESMRTEVMVNERDFDVLKLGLPVVLKVASHPTESFTGAVTRIAPQVEVQDGQSVIRVEAKIGNERGLLVPNMTGYAEIQAEPQPILSLAVRRVLRWVRVRFLI